MREGELKLRLLFKIKERTEFDRFEFEPVLDVTLRVVPNPILLREF